MAYKNDLQLAYSGREIALQRIAIIDSSVFNDQASRNYSEQRRTKYQRLLEKSEEKIAEIKGKITEDIGVKKFQLEESKAAYNHVSTRYKLGEISLQESEKQQSVLQKKYDRVKLEAVELDRLLNSSSSSEVGGQIPIDIDKEVDDYGNINRKMAGLNISTNIKMPNINALSNVKMPSSISMQGMNMSRGKLISLVGAIGVLFIIFVVLFAGYTAVTGVTVIKPCGKSTCSTSSYEWDGSTRLTITSPGEYEFANEKFPDGFYVFLESEGVTLDGRGVTLGGIDGDKTLNLKNMKIDVTIRRNDDFFEGAAITECNNIENSSIVIASNGYGAGWVIGIEDLYGNIDDTTTITITSQNDGVFGVFSVREGATISGGTFTITSQAMAYGVETVYEGATISGGTFTITSHEREAHGIECVDGGTVSGGKFTVTSKDEVTTGIETFKKGTVSGGTFTIINQQLGRGQYPVSNAYGVMEMSGGTISGGTFAATGQFSAGIKNVYEGATILGGEFTAKGQYPAGIALFEKGATITGGEFIIIRTGYGGSASEVSKGYENVSGGTFTIIREY
jgi:hypothetical protein